MFVQVNGVRLYFDVEGAGLVPDGAALREKPTLVLLHGGPGFDHALFKPAFSGLADIAQVIYYDHRGNGRSGGDDQEHLDARPVGRRREGPVRCARHRTADRVGAFVRRLRGAGLRDPPSGASRQADPRQHGGARRFRADVRGVRAHRRAEGARSRARLLAHPDGREPREIPRNMLPALSRAAGRQSVGQPQHHEGRGRADVQRPEQRAGPDGFPPGPRARDVSDLGDGRRPRSGDADAVQRDDRREPAPSPRALRAVPRQRPCSRCSTSRKRRSA